MITDEDKEDNKMYGWPYFPKETISYGMGSVSLMVIKDIIGI